MKKIIIALSLSANNAGTVQYMKKIVVFLFLAAIMILSGCIPFMQGYYNAVPNPEISESLISRMKNNIDTHSIEGFTGESTFGDVLNKITPAKISQAHLAYKTEILGYPAVMKCVFGNYKGQQLLDYTVFTVYRNGGGSGYKTDVDKLAAKMDSEFGSHEYDGADDLYKYFWELDGWNIDMSADKQLYEVYGEIACITISPDVVMSGVLPGTPDICPYKFGTDIETVYRSGTPAVLPDSFDDDVYLEYTDDGIEIDLQFKSDETGIWLCNGRYDIYLNDMGFEASLDYFDSLADGLESAVGTPLSRGYGILDVDTDDIIINVMDHEIKTGGQGMSSKDLLKSGKKYYYLDMKWPGINLDAYYCMGVVMKLDFSEEYFTAK